MADRITLTVSTDPELRGVATLVLGGIGSRLDLRYEQVDDLQLAVLSLLDARGEDEVTLEVEVDGGAILLSIGPLRPEAASSDGSLTRVLDPLVDGVTSTERDGREWLTLRLDR